MKHLAIFKRGDGEKILSGQKTIEARFSKKKITPFGLVSSGDLVYIKPAGKEVVGQFRVKKVIFYDGIDLSDLSHLGIVSVPEDAKYCIIIFIGQVDQFLVSPIKIPKKDSRGWVVLER